MMGIDLEEIRNKISLLEKQRIQIDQEIRDCLHKKYHCKWLSSDEANEQQKWNTYEVDLLESNKKK